MLSYSRSFPGTLPLYRRNQGLDFVAMTELNAVSRVSTSRVSTAAPIKE
jgi:hypothetical protein